MKTIFIHIGLPKTGTTSIQKFLTQNSKNLLNFNIFYPLLNTTYFNSSTNINGRFLIENSNYKKTYKKILKELESSKCKNLIFSDEKFVGRTYKIDRLNLFNREKYNFKIIFYIKRSVEFLCGAWQESLRYGQKENLINFTINGGSYIRRINKMYQFAEYFGKGNMIVKTFEPERFVNGNLIDDFLSIFSIENSNNFIQLEKRENTSISRHLAEKYLYLNNFVDKKINYNNSYSYRDSYIEKILNKNFKQKILSSLSDEQIKQISDKYYPLECKIATDFLDRSELFKQKYPKMYKSKRKKYKEEEMKIEEKQELQFVAQCILQQQIINNQKLIINKLNKK
jgi:hypothetical protein